MAKRNTTPGSLGPRSRAAAPAGKTDDVAESAADVSGESAGSPSGPTLAEPVSTADVIEPTPAVPPEAAAPTVVQPRRRAVPDRRRLMIFLSAVAAVVIVLGLIAGYRSIRASSPLLVNLVVPGSYQGWLVISWNCQGGEHLADHNVSGRRYSVDFSKEGTLCIADPPPSEGYFVQSYTMPDVNETTEVASPVMRALPHSVKGDEAGNTTVNPAITAGDHHYDIAYMRVIRRANAIGGFPKDQMIMGDQCSLVQFLNQQFGQPTVMVPCSTVPTRQQAGLEG